MGVGGHFWDVLKPYARHEDSTFLRGKRVAVDLSFWIVQHATAVPAARNPHLRLTFFRTVNLFARMGALPVFVLDGDPSPLKARARVERFFRATGFEPSSGELEGSVKRNKVFTRYVEECVELLELLGMPILRAKGEAEALCAQLNYEGLVDACITADSDALLFGATCVIKCLQSNSNKPFECYSISDIEDGLGLKRKHLIAISLLVGNDHDLHGVMGIGLDTALRFVKLFSEDEVLSRLCDIGKGNMLLKLNIDPATPDKDSPEKRTVHCSNCGHPGYRRTHLKVPCNYCYAYGSENCIAKTAGFKCECAACDKVRQSKEQIKHKNWQIKVCQKISNEQNFPNPEIIGMYLNNNDARYEGSKTPPLSWRKPEVDSLADFLAYHQHWEPSYTRQRILPLLSTLFLREMSSDQEDDQLLLGQYAFHSIQRIKVRYRCPLYVVKWKKVVPIISSVDVEDDKEQFDREQTEICGVSQPTAFLDETDSPEIFVDGGCHFILTEEDMGAVEAAFPEEVQRFLIEKEMKESKSKRRESSSSDNSIGPLKSTGVQPSITEFYRSNKHLVPATPDANPLKFAKQDCSIKKGKALEDTDPTSSKPAKRRLIFS